jgi:hypothetical protein
VHADTTPQCGLADSEQALLWEAMTTDEGEWMLEALLPPEVLMEGTRGHTSSPKGHLREGTHGPGRPLREGASECTWLLRDVPLEGTPTTLEARGTCQPKRKLPWEAIPKLRRPFGARKTNALGAKSMPNKKTPGSQASYQVLRPGKRG